jgi:hypothetical protein
MNSLQATAAVIAALEANSIPYILVGAFSSNAYGIARSTRDADFVVELKKGDLTKIMDHLGSEFRFEGQLQMELLTHSVKNVITFLPTKFDIELFRLGDDEHHRERFRRRQRLRISELNRDAWIPTAEDVVIQKLRWQRRKDLDDAVNVLAVSAGVLDWNYLEHWTKVHGTFDLLKQLRDELPDLSSLDE